MNGPLSEMRDSAANGCVWISAGAILRQAEDADTSSLLPCSPTDASGSGHGLLRQGSKRLWKRLASRESTDSVAGGGSATNGGGCTGGVDGCCCDMDDDHSSTSGVYNLLNNLNNSKQQQQPGCVYYSFSFRSLTAI